MAQEFDDPIEEAYASAPADVAILFTLEFWHPSFDVPARIVRDHGILVSEEPVIFGRMLTLEAEAPRNAGESVLFIATQFEARNPGSQANAMPKMELSIDGVPGDLALALKASVVAPGEIEVIYREYFADEPAGPHRVIDGLTLERTNVTMLRVTSTAGFSDPTQRAFPGTVYNDVDYPSLAQ